MLSYPPETTITNIGNYVLLVFPHGHPPRFWRYRVNRLVKVGNQAVDVEFVGAGVADSKSQAADCARGVQRRRLACIAR